MRQILIALVCVCAFGAIAAELLKPADGFKNTVSAGVALTDGNSETMQANAAIVTEGERTGLGSVRVGAEGNYGESTVDGEQDTTVENARAFANVKKTITARTYGVLDAAVLYDDIAQVDYRATLSPGLGTYVVKNARTALSFEAGPAYVWEKVEGETDDYFALRFAERFTHAISDTAKVWQSAEYLPKAADFDDYLATVEIGIEAALNTHMNLRLVLQDKYDNTPGEGLKRNDLALISGISVKF